MSDAATSQLRLPPAEALAELRDSTDRLLATVAGWDDAMVAGPSALPGWTRAHLLTHLARNADGMRNLAHWASTGVRTPMYTSWDDRAAAIEAGSSRSADALRADLAASAAQLDTEMAELDAAALERTVTLGREETLTPGWVLPLQRVREVEIHHVDLLAGYAPADWSERFTRRTLDQLSPRILDRGDSPVRVLEADDGTAWQLAEAGPALRGPSTELLAWLLGRSAGTRLTLDRGGRLPSPPAWS